jgi:drug/metabolite transporter (DMT)-like permease
MEKIIKINQVPLKIFLFLVINDLLDTGAQLLMKKGLGYYDLTGVNSFFFHFINRSNSSIPLFWTGFIIYLSNFILWMKILSSIDLSIALPLASISYILIPVASVLFLHEHVEAARWLGLALIVLGIYFVSQSSSRGKP